MCCNYQNFDLSTLADSEGCQLFGNSFSQTRSFSNYQPLVKEALLIDTTISSTCDGMGVAWNFCFYLVDTDPYFNQTAVLFVYRMSSIGLFRIVSGSELRVDIHDQYAEGRFHCVRAELPAPIYVLERDRIGACLQGNLTATGLDVLEEVDTERYLLQNTALNVEGCSIEALEAVVINLDGDNAWGPVNSIALNVNLEIGKHYLVCVCVCVGGGGGGGGEFVLV